jgi:DNA-directed RNA polymerase subunit RPC12/RpoP
MRPPNFTPGVLARADEEDLGDEDVAPGELVHQVGEEREVHRVERVPARPRRRHALPSRKKTATSSASTVSWDFSGMVGSGCFQTTCDFRVVRAGDHHLRDAALEPAEDSHSLCSFVRGTGKIASSAYGRTGRRTTMSEGERDDRGTRCDRCGAEMTWMPAEEALVCAYCEHRREVPRGEGVVEERLLEEAGSAAQGLDLELRVARCESCGARVAFDEVETAASCVYCGSSRVLEQEANRNAIRPESLVPLSVGRAMVEEKFRAWLRGLWFRPGDLEKRRTFEAIGVYVPFWTFDCRAHSDWTAESGTYYYVTERYTTTVNGKRVQKTRRKRKTRWRPASGSRHDRYDDLLRCASRGIPAELVAKLGDFDTRELVPYRSEYLAGWRAEEYQLDLEAGWSITRSEVGARQRSLCAGDVPGDTHRNLRVWSRIHDIRWKHVLLPVWSLAYRYRGKTYPVLVNGQTGRVVGKAPFSVVKIVLFVLVLVAIAVGAWFLFSSR